MTIATASRVAMTASIAASRPSPARAGAMACRPEISRTMTITAAMTSNRGVIA
jgi:hypothetical protein